MGFDRLATDAFRGELIVCKPYYGWGWWRRDREDSYAADEVLGDPNEEPRTFRVRIEGFFDIEQERRGFFGTVAEPNHLFDSLRIVATVMHTGEFDFETAPATRIDVEIGPFLPRPVSAEMTEGSPRYAGHIWAAVDEATIRRVLDQ